MKITFLILGFIISMNASAQLVAYPTAPQFMMYDQFLGSDYQVSNITFSGSEYSYGQFDGSQSNLGLDRGFVLSTGSVMDSSDGLWAANIYDDASNDFGLSGYSLTDAICGCSTYDAAVLSFDLVPLRDTLMIHYVFGSEEYTEYIGSDFTDVAGFWISGPGLVGDQNFGLLPDGSVINPNNVHGQVSNTFGNFPSVNGAYYVNNPSSAAPAVDAIQCDGFTENTYAFVDGLQVGETYHVVIAIADAEDRLYNSSLFLESCENCNYAVGLEEQEVDNFFFDLYPNPAHDQVTIKVLSEDASYSLSDLTGKTIQKGAFGSSTVIALDNVVSGVYLVTVTSGDRVQQRRLIVE